MDEAQKHYAEREKPDAKEYTLTPFMQSLKTGKNSCIVLEVRTLVASGGWN